MSYFLQIKHIFFQKELQNVKKILLSIKFQPQSEQIKITAPKSSMTVLNQNKSAKNDLFFLQSTETFLQILFNQNIRLIQFKLFYQINNIQKQKYKQNYYQGYLFICQIQKNIIRNHSLSKYIKLEINKINSRGSNDSVKSQIQQINQLKQVNLEDLQVAKLKYVDSPYLQIKITHNSFMNYLGKPQILKYQRPIEMQNQLIDETYLQIDGINQNKQEENQNIIQKKIIILEQNENQYRQEKNQGKENKNISNRLQDQNLQISQIMLQTIIQSTNSIHLTQQIWNQQSQQYSQVKAPCQQVPTMNIMQKNADNKTKTIEKIQKTKQQQQVTPQTQHQVRDQSVQKNKSKNKIFRDRTSLSFNHITIDKHSNAYQEINGILKFCCGPEIDTIYEKVLDQHSEIQHRTHQQ